MRTLPLAIASLDVLNSWIRSDSRTIGGNGIDRVIYHYKREALIEATRLKTVNHRRVSTKAKCRECGGSARYLDSNGYRHDHCYRCKSTGKVTLEFIESTIDTPAIGHFSTRADLFGMVQVVWHSPMNQAGEFTSDRHAWPVEECGSWSPHQKGNDLTADELAGHMMVVESAFKRRPPCVDDCYDYGYSEPFAEYTICLGETNPDLCDICGTHKEIERYGFGARSIRTTWTAHVCKGCHRIHRNGTHVFDVLRKHVPKHLITPAIQQWIDTHPAPARKESW